MNQYLPEFSYFDIIISDVNNTQITPQPIQYSEARNIPYLYEPDRYSLSVVRWTCDTSTLPIFRCQIKPNSNSAFDSIYSITLVYQGVVAQVYLQYSSQQVLAPTPNTPYQMPNGLQDNTNNYYDVYNYQFVIYLFNQTFQTALTALTALAKAKGITVPTTNPPVFVFDTINNIAVLYTDVAGYNSSIDSSIKIFFNPATANLFNSFPFYLVNTNSAFGMNYQLQVNIFSNANIIPYTAGKLTFSVYQVVQEFSTISNWNPVIAIVMCSNSLPVYPNNISGKISMNDAGIKQSASGNNAITNPVITDFVSDTGCYKPFIVYTPSAQYRRLSLLTGSSSLTNLDIQIYWRDRFGVLNPLLLGTGSTVSIKLLFELIK